MSGLDEIDLKRIPLKGKDGGIVWVDSKDLEDWGVRRKNPGPGRLAMNAERIVKNIESIVKVRDELYELQRKAEHLRRELDGVASEIVGFLKENGHLETRES